jgi:hypothetical protein
MSRNPRIVRDELKSVMYFETDELLEDVAERIAEGRSVLVMAEQYLGAGKWKLGKCRYKLLVPVLDKDGRLYSTDLFEKTEPALDGKYGIYQFTRQNAIKIILSCDADLRDERFGHGYTEEKYGRIPVLSPEGGD